ncbi:MAG: hypothetical protein IPI29_08450 [Ignavibacteria bacterium]|nr:hypothetical protein [Ignavibacteria bacterium]
MLASKGKRFQANDLNDNNIADVFLAMKDCTSDEEYRPVMHGIHLEQGNTAKETIAVTTNGFILASTLFTTTDDAIVNRNPDVVNDPTIQGSNTGNYDVTKRGALIYTETISTQSFPPWRNVVPSFPRMAGFSKQWAKGAMVALDVQKTFILDVAKALQAIDLVNSAEKRTTISMPWSLRSEQTRTQLPTTSRCPLSDRCTNSTALSRSTVVRGIVRQCRLATDDPEHVALTGGVHGTSH